MRISLDHLSLSVDDISALNSADGFDRPSKSRRKMAEMIDDLNVALGLKKGRKRLAAVGGFSRGAPTRQKSVSIRFKLLFHRIRLPGRLQLMPS